MNFTIEDIASELGLEPTSLTSKQLRKFFIIFTVAVDAYKFKNEIGSKQAFSPIQENELAEQVLKALREDSFEDLEKDNYKKR